MLRQKNTKSTYIYWLMDIRPETIAAGWLQGLPFYCGKTVVSPKERLRRHWNSAPKFPLRRSAKYINDCGKHVRIVVMEVVPPEGKWDERERYWIETSRRLFPDIMTNMSDGGDGVPGLIHSAETLRKLSTALRGRKLSQEHCAKIGALHLGMKRPPRSPEHYAKTVATRRANIAQRAIESAKARAANV